MRNVECGVRSDLRVPSARLRWSLLVGAAACSAAAQVSAQTPRLPPLVLRVPGSVRYAGLNGAGGALVGDAGAVFGNPAGLAIIRHIAVEGAFRRERFSGYVGTAAAAWRLRQFDLGGGVQYFAMGSDSAPGTSAGGGRPHEVLAVGTVVYRVGLIALGASAKWLRTSVGGVEERGAGGDMGLAIAVFDIMAIGFSIQNVGGNFDDASPLTMPRLSRLGFTMNYVDPQESFRLMSALEVQWPEGRGARLVLGGEAGTVVKGVGVVGRLAYGSPWPDYQPSRMTYGASVVLSRYLTADYAYEPSVAFADSRHRLGVRLTL